MKIYHYTSIQTLALILRNKKIRFNRLDKVDDMEESIYGSGPNRTKLGIYAFVSCWTKSEKENPALWKMYTDYKGVRIGLDAMPFKTYKAKDGFTSFFQEEMNFGSDYFILSFCNEAKLHDVIYVDNPEEEISAELILRLHKILLSNIRDEIAGRFRSGKEWVRVGTHIGANPEFVNGLIYELVEKYNSSTDEFFLDKIAYFHAEFENIHPFGDGNGRIGRLITNEQLDMLGLPPIIIPNKSKFDEYYPALDEYTKFGKTDRLTELFASLLVESLHRRIAKLTAKKIIPVADWAKNNNINLQSATNKAIRGTIPAFRVRGHWMIDEDFRTESAVMRA